MIRPALAIAGKDLRLTLTRGAGLVQALLLGLLLIFVFSLSREPGQSFPPQSAAAIFWLATVFCQVLVFSSLYSLEEHNGARFGLLTAPMEVQAVWLGKGLAGLTLIVAAQMLFLPAAVVFLGQDLVLSQLSSGLAMLAVGDLGLVALGSLLGGLAQGQAARESLLSILFFPLLLPLLLAAIRINAALYGAQPPEEAMSWFGLALAFDAMFLAGGLLLFPFVYAGEE